MPNFDQKICPVCNVLFEENVPFFRAFVGKKNEMKRAVSYDELRTKICSKTQKQGCINKQGVYNKTLDFPSVREQE